jgi:hypothetical protein
VSQGSGSHFLFRISAKQLRVFRWLATHLADIIHYNKQQSANTPSWSMGAQWGRKFGRPSYHTKHQDIFVYCRTSTSRCIKIGGFHQEPMLNLCIINISWPTPTEHLHKIREQKRLHTEFWRGKFYSVVGWGTILQAGRLRVRFPMSSFDFSII